MQQLQYIYLYLRIYITCFCQPSKICYGHCKNTFVPGFSFPQLSKKKKSLPCCDVSVSSLLSAEARASSESPLQRLWLTRRCRSFQCYLWLYSQSGYVVFFFFSLLFLLGGVSFLWQKKKYIPMWEKDREAPHSFTCLSYACCGGKNQKNVILENRPWMYGDFLQRYSK